MVAAGLGGLLMGAGTACLHVEWGRALGDLGSGATILHGVIGTVIAALLLGDRFCPGIFVRHRSGHFTFFGHQEPVVALSAASFALSAVSLGAGELATFMVFVLLASSLVMLDRKNLRTGWGMVRPSDFNEASSSFDAGCDLVCGHYDLTTREREVFALLAHGLNRASICNEEGYDFCGSRL